MSRRKNTTGGVKNWAIEAVMKQIETGLLTRERLAETNPKMLAAIDKHTARRRREERAPERFYGRAVRETAKAILFRIADIQQNGPDAPVGEHWFPLSQVQIAERALGDLDMLSVPPWLIAEKKGSPHV